MTSRHTQSRGPWAAGAGAATLPGRWRRLWWTASAAFALVGCSDTMVPLALSSEMDWRHVGVLQLESSVALAFAGPTQSGDNGRLRWDHPPDSSDVWTPPRILEVPVIVSVGKPFELTVYTIGRNGCWGPDGLEVRQFGKVIQLIPYDRHSGAGICTQVLSYLPHRTTLTLDEPGDWVIRVEGRRARYGDTDWRMPVVAETTVVAQ